MLPSVDSILARLAARNIAIPAGAVRLDVYGDSPALSEELLGLIREGRKRAGTSLLWACEAEGVPVPAAGDIEIVLDHRLEPAIRSNAPAAAAAVH